MKRHKPITELSLPSLRHVLRATIRVAGPDSLSAEIIRREIIRREIGKRQVARAAQETEALA
jgi:hypothetical protein